MMLDWKKLPLKIPKNRLKKNPASVGKAVYDILSKPQQTQEVGDTVQAMTERYYEELFSTVSEAKKKYDDSFYVVILRKKEPWALNVLRQWYVARNTRPDPRYLRREYPNHDHDVWKVDGNNLNLEWTLPTAQDASTIIKNKEIYGGDLVDWIEKFDRGELR